MTKDRANAPATKRCAHWKSVTALKPAPACRLNANKQNGQRLNAAARNAAVGKNGDAP